MRSDQRRIPESFQVSGLSKWNGRIVEVEDDIFTAELVPEEGGAPLLADFPVALLGESEVLAGDVVYVTSRRVAGPSGYQTLTSAVRLRRLGAWTEQDVARHQEWAEAEYKEFEDLVD